MLVGQHHDQSVVECDSAPLCNQESLSLQTRYIMIRSTHTHVQPCVRRPVVFSSIILRRRQLQSAWSIQRPHVIKAFPSEHDGQLQIFSCCKAGFYYYKSTILLIVVFREEEKSQQRFYDMIACKKGFRVASPASDPYTLLLLLYILICGPHGHPKKARSVLLLLLLCVCVH